MTTKPTTQVDPDELLKAALAETQRNPSAMLHSAFEFFNSANLERYKARLRLWERRSFVVWLLCTTALVVLIASAVVPVPGLSMGWLERAAMLVLAWALPIIYDLSAPASPTAGS